MTNNFHSDEMLIRRADLAAIAEMIPHGARILDLGCGSGRLLKALKTLKEAKVTGVEISQKKILECAARGVPVIQANLDEDLPEFSDHSYDYVILSRTLQAVRHPAMLVSEMLRIGERGIVSFINFGQVNARMQMFLGNMPVTENLPLQWYETPNIHPGTISDFRRLCRDTNIKIIKEIPLTQKGDMLRSFSGVWPNLFASTCIFIIEK